PVAGLLPLLLALQLLAEVLGATSDPPPFAGAGRLAWTFAAEAAAALACARRANSAACTLIAALAGAVAVESAVRWVFGRGPAPSSRRFSGEPRRPRRAGACRDLRHLDRPELPGHAVWVRRRAEPCL